MQLRRRYCQYIVVAESCRPPKGRTALVHCNMSAYYETVGVAVKLNIATLPIFLSPLDRHQELEL
jgi:hypothetical protein